MQDYRFRIGMCFLRQGRRYVVEQRLADGNIRILDTTTTTRFAESEESLIEELFSGSIELLGEDEERSFLKDKLSKTGVTDLTYLKEDDSIRREIERREAYVRELVRAQPLARTAEKLTPLILKVGHRIGDTTPPSSATINRWYRAFIAAGEDVRALAPSNKARGNRRPKASGKQLDHYAESDYERALVVKKIVDRIVRTKYLNKSRPSVQEVYEAVKDWILKENEYRDPSDRLPIPHISSLHKTIASLDPYEVDKAQRGKKYADEKHKANKQGPRPKRPLERVECDHTKIDMMVVDTETRLPLGRPLLTAIIDVYTKMILGIYLSFHGEGAHSVMQCLLHAIRPKSYIKTKYAFLEHDWPTHGIPEVIVTDNGSGFHSRHYEDACRQLGIKPQYSPFKQPWFRGTVERWFGTHNKRLLHRLPGTTFSNIFERSDYDPKKHAVISLEALLELIHVFIVDIYHQTYHRGIHDIPFRRWVEATASWSPNLPPSANELEVLIGFTESRCVRPSGVELHALFYNSSELRIIRQSLKRHEKVTVKIDPTDISSIYVWDKERYRFVRVPALNQEYTAGLSLWQHEVIRKFARRAIMGQIDDEALCRARLKVQEIVEQERLLTNNIKNMQKAARFLNISQPDYVKEEQVASIHKSAVLNLEQPGDRIRLLPGSSVTSINRDNEGVGQEVSDEPLLSTDAGWSSDYDLPV